jgi:hypothetical protein
MNSIFLYSPNILNYIRLLLLVISMNTMLKSPLVCFMTAIFGGILDLFDGRLSRLFNKKSVFGALLDMGMDSMTNLMQLFFLGSVYPKKWTLFFTISIIEIFNETLTITLLNYEFILNILKQAKSKQSENATLEVFLTNSQIHDFVRLKGSITEFKSMNEYIFNEFIYPYILYSSDLFYWIIYFGYFIRLKNHTCNLGIKHDYTKLTRLNESEYDLSISVQSEDSLNRSCANKSKTETLIDATLAIPSSIHYFICYFNDLFIEIGHFIDNHCSIYVKFISFKLLSLICGYSCLIGAILKVYLNTIGILNGLYTIAGYDLLLKQQYPIKFH